MWWDGDLKDLTITTKTVTIFLQTITGKFDTHIQNWWKKILQIPSTITKRVVMCIQGVRMVYMVYMRDYSVFAVSVVVCDRANRTSDRGYFIGG